MTRSKATHLFEEFLPKLKDAVMAIIPVVVVMLIIPFIVPSMNLETGTSKFGPIMTSLCISAVPLILGTTLFELGVEKSLARIGEIVGTTLTKRKSIGLLLFIGFLMGVLATLAEPDLSVLASRISPSGPDWSLIATAALGVGVFMLVAILRVIYDKPLKYWLCMGYGLVFTLGLLADEDFFSIVFDAGGVTTGVVTVPFILAIGVSVARILGGDNAEDDSFGYSGLCSLGTVLSVMVFTLIISKTGGVESIQAILARKVVATDSTRMFADINEFNELGGFYLDNFLQSLKDVSISMLPITVFFLVYDIFLKLNKKEFLSIIVGLVYTFFGLILFLMGAESGFIPIASAYGQWFASDGQLWLFILLGFFLGAVSMLAEPSVKVLAVNVSDVSRGVIPQYVIYLALCLATGSAIILNIIRVEQNIPFVYFIVPLFVIALALSFLSPDIYVGIAVDAAGVATGTMASCFFLPLFIAYTAVHYASSGNFGRDIMANGFGIVGIMSVMPIIAVELIGIFSVARVKFQTREALKKAIEPDDNQVVHLPVQA